MLSGSTLAAVPLVPHWLPCQSGGTFNLPLSSSIWPRPLLPWGLPPAGQSFWDCGGGLGVSLHRRAHKHSLEHSQGLVPGDLPQGVPLPLHRGREWFFKVFCGRFNSKIQAAFLFIMHKKSKSVFLKKRNLELEALENLQKYTNASL